MKYVIGFNQKMALELGIANANQAHIFDLLTTASTWATPVTVGKKVYYWVSRQSIARELEILHLKPDTVYRHLKALADLGLIDYKKDDKKDCIKLTAKGKKYLSDSPMSEIDPSNDESTMSETDPNHYVGNRSESDQNSEIDPKKLGNRSEKGSEIDPTYPTTNTNPTTKDQEEAEASTPVPKKSELKKTARTILDYLNEKTGRSYQPVDGTLQPIVARMREGFDPRTLCLVIQNRIKKWGADPKMAEYLRPKTLFGKENFANYVGELGAPATVEEQAEDKPWYATDEGVAKRGGELGIEFIRGEPPVNYRARVLEADRMAA